MSSVGQSLKGARAFIMSRKGITVFKGALAYTLVVLLPMLNGFDDLEKVPTALSAAVILSIAGFPGKSTGEHLFGVILALMGVGIGAVNFVILSKLRVSLVSQVIVFAIMVYLLALLKGADPRLFGFALLAILMTFNGVYVSILVGSFSPKYLEGYLEAYAWGAAIVVFVNLFVFPISTEKELRQTLVLSLDHIGTLSHLLAKTYTMTLTEEDRALRDKLNQTIRQDFGLLNQKIGASAIEINWSRWSVQDYHALISQTRTLQLSLIAMYSSLTAYEKTPVPLWEERFLPSTINTFNQLRRDTHRTIVEIQLELGCKPSETFGAAAAANAAKAYYDLEQQDPSAGSGAEAPSEQQDAASSGSKPEGDGDLGGTPSRPPPVRRPTMARAFTEEDMKVIGARLLAEVERDAPHPPDVPNSESGGTTALATPGAGSVLLPSTTEEKPKNSFTAKGEAELLKMRGCAKRLKKGFLIWEAQQRDVLTDAITGGQLTGGDMTLYVREPRPSIWDAVGPDHVRGHAVEVNRPDMMMSIRQRRAMRAEYGRNEASASALDVVGGDEDPSGVAHPDTMMRDMSANHSLMRVFSVIFALDQFTTALAQAHALVKETDAKGRPRRKGLHFHLFESISRKKHIHSDSPLSNTLSRDSDDSNPSPEVTEARAVPPATNLPTIPDEKEMTMREAIAHLEGRKYVPIVPTFWQRLKRLEEATHGENSVYALKVMGASLVFGALIWAEGSRAFFIKYNITGSLITVVVALTPTLGQSLRSFVLQIAGSSSGYIMGMIFLEIFRNVGGYHFNPYGLVCLLALFSIPMNYLLYFKPQLFTFNLLAMNACAVLIVSEYVNVVHSKSTTYGDPPIRVGRALTGLAIALIIVLGFQLLVLRNPARRTLRKALAKVVYSNLSYNTILQSLVRASMPADPSFTAPESAVRQTVAELAHRETKIQGQILGLMPLVQFAQDEPQMVKKFEGAAIARIIRANQTILDRQAEARTALGTARFSRTMIEQFVTMMSPYRKRILKITQGRFVMVAASLASKTPLPHDSLHAIPEDWLAAVTHDALVLSQEFAKTPEGRESIRNGEFTRFWFYLLSISSLNEQLEIIEDACRTLFGEIEDDPRLS
ncbi:hypothetical protein DL93DRAFT_2089397 [Clavulina sp. PMI_390]|nr:hypothetical protein DL93DRAFT_2089397 [Clavulina sp. PMI_390]